MEGRKEEGGTFKGTSFGNSMSVLPVMWIVENRWVLALRESRCLSERRNVGYRYVTRSG